MKVVCLISGGLDSSSMMLLLKEYGHEVYPLHVNYGHRAEEKEWASCQKVTHAIHANRPYKINISGLEIIRSGLLNENLDIVKYAFLPTRNLLFLTLGAAYAFNLGIDTISIGLLSNPIFPDQGKEFLEKAKNSLSAALGEQINILAPFIDLDKRDIIKLAKKHQLPVEMTYYCHAGTDPPCGVCISCKERIMAEKLLKAESDGL